ncbi:MAG: transposase [Candidatus Krumholzibacteriota bacterium]|nr:transposase [Candidatus Krumholzibacteriota bacterium]
MDPSSGHTAAAEIIRQARLSKSPRKQLARREDRSNVWSREEYNSFRPHSSLDNLTPREYALKHEENGTSKTEILALQAVWENGAGQDQTL